MNPRFRKPMKREGPKDEYAIILDIIEDNSKSFNKKKDIIQAIGTLTYRLLELVPKDGVYLKVGQKVYIGNDKRDEIQYIKRSLFPNKLSGTAKSELLYAIEDIIEEREEEYVKFFNVAGPITIRKHALELIPRIGKKHLQELLEERKKGEFKSFKDIEERCPYIGDVIKAIAQRIQIEIEGEDDFKFFIKR